MKTELKNIYRKSGAGETVPLLPAASIARIVLDRVQKNGVDKCGGIV